MTTVGANMADEQNRRVKRHALPAVIGITLLIVIIGGVLGEVALGLVGYLFSEPDEKTLLLLRYLSAGGTGILVIVYCLVFEKDVLRSFRHPKHGGMGGNTLKAVALGLFIGFLMNGACALLAWLHGDIQLSVGQIDVVYLLAALPCVCVQSGSEELATRGYMLGALRDRYPVWVAVVANSLLFGVLHLANSGITALSFVQIVLVGLALSLVVYYLGSFWMSVAIHTAWNYTQNFLFGLPNSGNVAEGALLHLDGATDSLFYNTTFGLEGGLTAAFVLALLALVVLWYGRRRVADQADDNVNGSRSEL